MDHLRCPEQFFVCDLIAESFQVLDVSYNLLIRVRSLAISQQCLVCIVKARHLEGLLIELIRAISLKIDMHRQISEQITLLLRLVIDKRLQVLKVTVLLLLLDVLLVIWSVRVHAELEQVNTFAPRDDFILKGYLDERSFSFAALGLLC